MEKFIFIINKNFQELPKTSGVYCFLSEKEIIYIGKAINIQNRVKNHFQQPSYRDNLFIHKVNKIGYIETKSEIEALILEASLIKKQQPKFNVVWKDDKNYFYVAITNSIIPSIYITHQPNKQLTTNHLTTNKIYKNPKLETRSYKPDVNYIGPFVEGTALKKTLKFLRRAFPYYTSEHHPNKKCTYCHLDLCPGPLLFQNPPSPEALAKLQEYKKNIKKLILILEGKKITALNSLKKEMTVFSKNNNFEKAAIIRDRIFNLQKIMSHSGVLQPQKEQDNNNWDKTQQVLQKITNLSKKISKIECYDISNIQGKQATGSMVVFVNGKPDKSQYKKFKIRIENEPNDIAMLEEIITRRLAHKEWTYPEIMLIDGGIAQLNIAVKSKSSNNNTKDIKIISIAKKDKDLYIEGQGQNFIPLKNLPQEIYNLILQLDDEAHRFAITYHKKLRKQNLFK